MSGFLYLVFVFLAMIAGLFIAIALIRGGKDNDQFPGGMA